jgi:predicted nucleic acid-binding protein
MDAVLLDTDVFSYLMKPNDSRAALYRPHIKDKTVAVSFVTVGELYYGAQKRQWSHKSIQSLEDRLKAVVIVPYDAELCRVYARTRAAIATGFTVAPNDLWIASCAIRHGVPLITNNRRHFERIPRLTIISENPVPIKVEPKTGRLFRDD